MTRIVVKKNARLFGKNVAKKPSLEVVSGYVQGSMDIFGTEIPVNTPIAINVTNKDGTEDGWGGNLWLGVRTHAAFDGGISRFSPWVDEAIEAHLKESLPLDDIEALVAEAGEGIELTLEPSTEGKLVEVSRRTIANAVLNNPERKNRILASAAQASIDKAAKDAAKEKVAAETPESEIESARSKAGKNK